MVVSVIMYNCSSWAAYAISDILKHLDICHRKHLRQILKIKYPTTISNEILYKKCSTTPLSTRVKVARWRMLGHVLRSPENSPAALALQFSVEGSSALKGRRGKHQNNLLGVIRSDLARIHFSDNPLLTRPVTLTTAEEISLLRTVASNRRDWSNLFNYVV